MLLQIDRVRVAYGAHTVIEEASLAIDEADRIGLIGRNGTGKTSLFQVLCGQLEPGAGQVTVYRHCRIGILRQEMSWPGDTPADSVLRGACSEILEIERSMHRLEARMADAPDDAALLKVYGDLQHRFEQAGGYDLDARIRQVVQGLGLPPDVRSRTVSQLSGGQQNRLGLAGLLLSSPNLLMLDEPTNHLDLDAIEWLERYLTGFSGAFVIVSHDRTFLNRTVRRIIEIEAGRLHFYAGDYDAYRLQRIERRARQEKLFERQQAEIARLEDFVRRNIAGQNTHQAQARRKALKKLDRLSRPPQEPDVMNFRLEPAARGPERVAWLQDAAFAHPGHPPLFASLDLTIHRGQKIGLIGPNGMGKSTLMALWQGRLAPTQGEAGVGEAVRAGYLDQHMGTLDRDKTVLAAAWDSAPDLTRGQIMGALGAFQFSGSETEKKVRNLSGGQKARLAFLKLQLERPNLLLADEPTNHLDIPTREALEEALADYAGTILIISHDRYFLDEVVDRIGRMDRGRLEVFEGNFSDYEERRDRERAEAAARSMPPKAEPPPAAAPAPNPDRKRRRETERLEREIDGLETRIAALEGRMADPKHARDWEKMRQWADEKGRLQEQLDGLVERWAALSESL